MSENLLYSFGDVNPDLKKQIGCMNGILQLFHRRRFVGSQRISSNNHKRLPPGQNGNHGKEHNCMTTQQAIENNQKEVVKGKQGVSLESSRTSLSSSSCSSTFSSVDCNRIAQPEPSSLGHNTFSGTPSQMLSMKQSNSSSHLGQQSLDIRDVVKDSIYREARGLSVKTTTKEKGMSHVVKHVDSPRPMQQSKSVNLKVSGLDGSFRVLAKLREAPRSSYEEKHRTLPPKDVARFSYDGRESRDTWKSVMKVKELPRLSLDSREGSIKRSASESRSNYLLVDLRRGNAKSSHTLSAHQEPGSNKRPSSAVAKLMGLEAFPDSISGNDDQIRITKCDPDEAVDTMSTSSRKTEESKHNQVSSSPRTTQSEPALPQLRNFKTAVKPTSRIPLELAPWSQPDANRGSHKPAFPHREAPTMIQNSCPSVYGEIEKRLTELEFKRSGKDLRALKQILEAMQKSKQRLENKMEDRASSLEPKTRNHGSNDHNLDQDTISATHRIHITPTIKGSGSPKKSGSSIVVIKPANVLQKPRNSSSSAIPLGGISGLHKLQTRDNADSRKDLYEKRTANDLTPRNNHFREPSCQPIYSSDKSTYARTFKSAQTSKVPRHMSGGNPTSSGRSSTTVSPRLQQKKHGMEKQSHPTIQTLDSRRTRRHLSKQQMESGSPGRKFRPKTPNLQEGNDQSSTLSSETRHLSYQSDAISVQSEGNISLASQTDTDVTSIDLKDIKGAYQAYQHKDQKNEITASWGKDRSKDEPTTATLEQPSPVSVLDSTFYSEEPPSPVQKISTAFKDKDVEETLNSDEAEWNFLDIDHLLNSTGSNFIPEFDQEKLENINHLVHNLKHVNSTHDEAVTDYIASLCDTKNPEHRYITEILLASGILLNDLGSSSTITQLHPSGQLINPSLFLVLEQTKGRIELSDDKTSTAKNDHLSKFNEKIRRKLIFDTVNEILVLKLTSAGFSEPWIYPNKLGRRSFSAQKLLKELCSEMDHLQAKQNCSSGDENDDLISILTEDTTSQTQNWADYNTEVPGIVLDVERLIFKDLIDEVVSLQGRPTKHCRKLFSSHVASFHSVC